jgi:protein involved in polysaccharide export with SLBB domain
MNGYSSLNRRRTLRNASHALALAGMAAGLVGCEANSFFDPSKTGSWKNTPTVMPILDRLSSIEDEPTEFVQTSPVMPNDLVPEIDQVRFSPGDTVEIRIQDFYQIGREESFDRPVDSRGNIELPRLAPVRAQGKTTSELITALENAVRAAQVNDRPIISLNVRSQRKQTFAVMGGVQNPGTFFIPSPDYRLLEGITAAGAFNESIPYIYVVRQIPLTKAAAGEVPDAEPSKRRVPGRPPSDGSTPPGAKDGDDLNKVIDDLIQSKDQPKSPAAMGAETSAAPVRAFVVEPPAIDLPDPNNKISAPTQTSNQGNGWVFADGKWVKLRPGSTAGQAVTEQTLVTQRVIKIPTGPLLAGAADVNIVLRPGDVVRAPIPRGGLVYVAGEVSRPGPYNLPSEGRLTLQRAIDAAGGLNNIAIPDKIDVTRMVGSDRQATIRLNLAAISSGAQPDIYLKPDDRINVGTNFWAQPVAVLRNGFRASYGFGFILDRNFQGDVFGQDRSFSNTGN